MFQEMEPYLPATSKCARFCLSAATVIFWVTEYVSLSCVCYSQQYIVSIPPSVVTRSALRVCAPTDFSDRGLYHRGHSIQAGCARCLCKYH